MKKTYLHVQKEFCGECSLALMRFVGKMKGVDSVAAENGKVAIVFDETLVDEKALLALTKDVVERLGYRMAAEEAEED